MSLEDEATAGQVRDDSSRRNLSLSMISASDLPRAVHDGNRWYGKFIPTAIQFLGTRSKRPWRFCVRDLQTLQDIWTAIYGETLPWKIELNDCIHASVSTMWPTTGTVAHPTSKTIENVRKWRDHISNAALRAFERFFQYRTFADFVSRFQFCQAILRDSRLFYEAFDAPYRRVS